MTGSRGKQVVIRPLRQAYKVPIEENDDTALSIVCMAFAQLPERYQVVLHCRLVQGLTMAQTGCLINTSRTRVMQLEYQALRMLRDKYHIQERLFARDVHAVLAEPSYDVAGIIDARNVQVWYRDFLALERADRAAAYKKELAAIRRQDIARRKLKEQKRARAEAVRRQAEEYNASLTVVYEKGKPVDQEAQDRRDDVKHATNAALRSWVQGV